MNVAVFEFNAHHDECLYSHLLMLKQRPDVKVYFICYYKFKDRIKYWDQIEDVLFIGRNQWGIGYLKIWRFLLKNNISTFIFNSVYNPSVLRLIRFSGKRIKKYGVMHNCENFASKLTKGLNKKMDGYFVLSDHLVDYVNENQSIRNKVQSFYTIFYPKLNDFALDKNEDELWITIPGSIEAKRRDYEWLLDSIAKENLNKNIKLIFLGKSRLKSNHYRDDFEKIDSNHNCVFWDTFIGVEEFHSYIKKSDYILPLINENNEAFKFYDSRISGAFNLAFGYKIPMILDNCFMKYEDLRDGSLFYDSNDSIVKLLNSLHKKQEKGFYNLAKWEVEWQANRYWNFIS